MIYSKLVQISQYIQVGRNNFTMSNLIIQYHNFLNLAIEA